MEERQKKIDYRFKILYAVAMIMVVCTHTEGGGIDLFGYWFPYPSIQLAIFAFASGYFYKKSAEKNAWAYIWRKFKQLIIPMYIYNFLYGLLVKILSLHGWQIGGYFTWESFLIYPLTDGNQFFFNVGGWFVVPLFLMQTANVLFRRLLAPFESERFQIPEWFFMIIAICLGLLGNTLAIKGYAGSSWWMLLIRPLHLIPFFEAGTFYKRTLEKYDTLPSVALFGLLFLAKFLLAAVLGRMPDYTPMWCNDLIDGPAMPIIVGFLGIAFWLRIARILEPAIGKSKAVNAIADSTYSIMINQFLGFMLVKAGFGLLSEMTPFFPDFSWSKYMSDIWWYYKPFNLEISLIFYLIAGIVVPILIQKGLNFAKRELQALEERSPERPRGLRKTHAKLTLDGASLS